MNIVSLLENSIHLYKQKSSLFGKKQIFSASVTIPVEEAKLFNVDIWALHLRKAVDSIPEAKFTKGKIKLILGERFFTFIRIEVPIDIQDSALEKFIQEKALETLPDLSGGFVSRFFLGEYKGKKIASVFALKNSTLNEVKTLLSFYDMSVEEIYPEAVLIYKLFEHTLNKKKEEDALFLEYQNDISHALMFDSVGLKTGEVLSFNSKTIKEELKTLKGKSDTNIARLILGGELSLEVRQDNFTKETGLWTNPLEKVLLYSTYKDVARKNELEPKLLEFGREIALLKLLEDKTAVSISLLSQQKKSAPVTKINTGSMHAPSPHILKYLLVSLSSSLITLLIVTFLYRNLASMKFTLPKLMANKPSPTMITPTKAPRPTPEPASRINKAELSIDIQNGSGTPGMANKVKAALESKDYTINNVGNADSFDYENTTIIAPTKEIFNLLAKDLKTYKVAKPVYEKTNTSQITVIIGTDLEL